MTSPAKRIGLPLAVLACTVALAGCNGSSKPAAASSSSGTTASSSLAASVDSGGADTHSAIYLSECHALSKILGDQSLPAAARDPEKVIANFKNGAQWSLLSSQQQTDAVAGIRKAATGSCS